MTTTSISEPDDKAAALERASRVLARLDTKSVQRLYGRAFDEKRPEKKITWLRQMTSHLESATDGLAPCRRGCSHCCNVPVLITEYEAKVIGAQIGRTVDRAAVTESTHIQNPAYIGTPCPFLKDNACSIYVHRPLLCRTHYSMSDSSDLCDVKKRPNAIVPLLDSHNFTLAAMSAIGRRALLVADIRDFFKPEPEGADHENR